MYTLCVVIYQTILSKMLNFVIFWEASAFFSIFQFLSKMVHFVIFETRTSNYEIRIKEYYVYTMCCDISNYFCQKCPILSFCERLVYFSLLQFCQKCLILSFSERPLDIFSIFLKNGPFCHFWNGDFKLWDKYKRILCIHYVLWYIKLFCQKCSILSFSERPVYFFASSNLSKMLNFVIFWERKMHFFHFFNFVKNGPFCHFWNVDFKLWGKYKYTMCTVCVVIYQTILSKMLNFVIFWETRVFFRFFSLVKNA